MKRQISIGGAVVMAASCSASAAGLYMTHNGIRNDSFTLPVATSAVVEFWASFEDDATAGVGDNGKAVMLEAVIFLDSLDNCDAILGCGGSTSPATHIEWHSGFGGDGGVAPPGGFYAERRGAGPRFEDYNLVYVNGAELDFNVMTISDGWSAATGLVYHFDNILMNGAMISPAGKYDKLTYADPAGPRASKWDEGEVDADGVSVIGFAAQDVLFDPLVRGAAEGISVRVVPESASLLLLALGAAWAGRRRCR